MMDKASLENLLAEGNAVLLEMREAGLDNQHSENLGNALAKGLMALGESRNIAAITGTMKAGKSTTLNVILGGDLLPSRERAMTALPTLLRHDPDRERAILHLPAAKEYNKMLLEMRGKFLEMAEDADPATAKILNDLGELNCFLDVYEEPDIKRALSQVNDLIREGIRAGYPVPQAIIKNTAAFPYIIKAFDWFVTAGIENQDLWLMDTPGPDEAGMENLGQSLEKYLANVSAIILIVDYTKQGTQAFAGLFDAIYRENPDLKQNTSILLNKIDQQKANDSDLDEQRARIAAHSLNGSIPPERIYPVCAKYAFYAKEATRRLARGDSPESLGEDFWKLLFGSRWKQTISQADPARCQKYAAELYDLSGFADALDGCFLNSGTIQFRERQRKAISELRDAVASMGEKIARAQTQAETECEASRQLDDKYAKLLQNSRDSLALFRRLIGSIEGRFNDLIQESLVAPEDLVTADVEKDYWYSSSTCRDNIAEICLEKNEEFQDNFEDAISQLTAEAKETVDKIKWDLNAIIHDFPNLPDGQKEKIYVKFEAKAGLLTPNQLITPNEHGDYIKKTRNETSYTVREGVTGWLGSLFDDVIDNDWGKTRKYDYETRYNINAALLNEYLLKNAEKQLQELYKRVLREVAEPFIDQAKDRLASLEASCDLELLEETHEKIVAESREVQLKLIGLNKLAEKHGTFSGKIASLLAGHERQAGKNGK